jgi:hypothetical protein
VSDETDAVTAETTDLLQTLIRFYYGVNDKGEPSLVLVGVGKDDNDMVDGALMDIIIHCPPFCGDGNSLNT